MWPYLALAVGAGAAMALGWPAARAMPPTLCADLLQNAMTLRSIASQAGGGRVPRSGGSCTASRPDSCTCSRPASCVISSGIVMAMHRIRPPTSTTRRGSAASVESVLEGLRFVRRTEILLGAILLDLLAVLFGGAVALLPVFARSILHVGAAGLGILRAAPAIGALLAAVWITRHPIERLAPAGRC